MIVAWWFGCGIFGGFLFCWVSGAVWLVDTLVFVVCGVGFGVFVCWLCSVAIVG